jgi:exonuclease III
LLDNKSSALGQRIDYAFVRDAIVRGCRVVGAWPDDRTVPGGMWPSDHAGVVARLQFQS